MADIKISCEACGTENTFSEYARSESRVCSSCSAPLQSLAPSGRKKLRIRDMSNSEAQNTTLQGQPLHPEQVCDSDDEQARAPRKKTKTIKSKPPSSLLLGVVVFLLVAGLLVGAQYCIESGINVAGYDVAGIYSWLRLVFLGVASLLVVIEAFRESQFAGVLAILIPPYLIYYAMVKLDSFWRQGVFIGVMVALGMELHFMKEDAIITHCDNYLQSKINFVSDGFERVRE